MSMTDDKRSKITGSFRKDYEGSNFNFFNSL